MTTQSAGRSGQLMFRGWGVLAALMFVFVPCMAFPFFGAGVLNAVMAKDLGLSRTTVAAGFSVMALCSGLMGPLVAASIGRIGARFTMAVGALIVMVAGLLLATIVKGDVSFIVCFGAVLGCGVAMATALPAQGVVTQWFSKRLAFALSLLWLAVGAGGAITAPVLGAILKSSSGNWAAGWYLMAALAAVAAVVAVAFVRNKPADVGTYPDGIQPQAASDAATSGGAASNTPTWPVRIALRLPAFWSVMICGVIYSIPLTLMFAYIQFHLGDLGFSPTLAASSLGLMGASQVAGKIAVGVLGDRMQPRFLWGGAMVLMAGGLGSLAVATQDVHVHIAAVMIGIGQGGCLVAMPALIGQYFGRNSFVGLYAAMTPVITVMIALAPIAVGYSQHVAIPGYGAAFLAFGALLVLGAAAISMTRAPTPRSA
jgi:MFS family permease